MVCQQALCCNAAGIAEREGLITLDEYIYPWFEKYFPSNPSENLY